jgi:hypothetical protein
MLTNIGFICCSIVVIIMLYLICENIYNLVLGFVLEEKNKPYHIKIINNEEYNKLSPEEKIVVLRKLVTMVDDKIRELQYNFEL